MQAAEHFFWKISIVRNQSEQARFSVNQKLISPSGCEE